MSEFKQGRAGTTRRTLLGGICAFSLAAGSGILTAGGAQAASAGSNFVLKAGADLIAAARAGGPSGFRALLRAYIDVTSMALFALGKFRKNLPEGQRSEYVSLVEGYMVHTLAQFGKKFQGRKFEVVNSRATSRGLAVESNLKFLGGKKQKVQWKLVGSGGNYRVADINFQGVWLAGLLRSTFTSLIKKNGNSVEGLMAHLRKSTPGNATIKSDFNG